MNAEESDLSLVRRVQRGDVGVAELGLDRGLAREPRSPGGIAAEVAAQDLERDPVAGGAIDGGIVCELVLRAMDRDQDIIYAGQSHTGKSGPREYLAVMRNQHLIHIFRCRPWSGDSNAPVILVSECGKVTIRLGSDGAFECLVGAPSDIAGGHCRALARIARVAAATRTLLERISDAGRAETAPLPVDSPREPR